MNLLHCIPFGRITIERSRIKVEKEANEPSKSHGSLTSYCVSQFTLCIQLLYRLNTPACLKMSSFSNPKFQILL